MTESTGGHVLIAGVTTRPLAVSAARAGYGVTAVDAFGDLDLRKVAEVIRVRGPRTSRGSALAMAIAAEQLPATSVAYTSNFENYPDAVTRLSHGRCLLGNPAEVLTRVRNPIELSRVVRRHGLMAPETRASAPTESTRGSWLVKPRRSGGGHGIEPWSPGSPMPRHSYLQKRISGIAGSVVFAANRSGSAVLGFSRQVVGDSRLGSHGFRYCGSLLGTPSTPLFPHQAELLEKAAELARVVTREFGLVGLNGIDFIARKGVPYLIEVNPRYSSSMELVERSRGVSLFEVHVNACRGVLPRMPDQAGILTQGKAIVFARRDVVLGDTLPWTHRAWLADIPHPGERIGRGHPICTVLAQAADGETCYRVLIRRATRVYRLAEPRRKRAA